LCERECARDEDQRQSQQSGDAHEHDGSHLALPGAPVRLIAGDGLDTPDNFTIVADDKNTNVPKGFYG
jgi:hypothetical protein